MNDNVKSTSFRVGENAVERFKELSAEMNMTQKEFFDSLISTYELENAKSKITSRSKEIEEFQGHAERIISIFLNSLELNQDAEKRIEEKYQDVLQKKNQVIDNIQESLNKEKAISEQNRKSREQAEKDMAALRKTADHLEEINKNNSDLVEQYKEKVDTLSTLVNEYKGYKESIETVQAELNEKAGVCDEQKHRIRDLEIQKENSDKQTEFYKKQIEELKAELKQSKANEAETMKTAKQEVEAATEKIRTEFEEKLGFMAEKKDLEVEKEKMDLQKSHEKEMESLNKKHKKETDQLVKAHGKEIEELKKQAE